MNPIKLIVGVIVVCLIVAIALYLTVPKINPLIQHQVEIDTHGYVPYYLTIMGANDYFSSETVVEEGYTIILDHGRYDMEVCYYDVEGKTRCEGREVYVDEGMLVEFFVVIDSE